jgi:hypothetical protein
MSRAPNEDSQFQKLVDRLSILTKRGIIHWQKSRQLRATLIISSNRGPEPFSMSLTETTIRIRSRDGDGIPPFVLEILDSEGLTIQVYEATSPQEGDMLAYLYQLVRRDALNVEGVIDSALRDLDSLTEIPNTNEEDTGPESQG